MRWRMSVESSQETQVEAAVYGMWAALSVRDWQAVKSYLSQDCLYLDMPVGPAAAARGPADIVKRLKIGLEPLASYENFTGLMVSNGVDVMYEHREEWHWATDGRIVEVRRRSAEADGLQIEAAQVIDAAGRRNEEATAVNNDPDRRRP